MGKWASKRKVPVKDRPEEIKSPQWGNRIVGHGFENPNVLVAHPLNYRIHPRYQQEALHGALEDIGWTDEVTVNRTTGKIVDGHLRVTLAILHNQEKVPVKYIEVNEQDELKSLATKDLITNLAEVNHKMLAEIEQRLDTEGMRPGWAGQIWKDVHDEAPIEKGQKGKDQTNEEAVLLDQAVQLRPERRYVMIQCDDDNGEDWERLKQILKLKSVRRGGYRPGDAFDDIGPETVIPAKRFFEAMYKGT